MSELLGWYGYNKVDSDCTRSLNLDHFSSVPHTKNNQILQIKPNFISNGERPKSPRSFNGTNLPSNDPNVSLQYSTNNLISTREQIPSSVLPLKKGTADFTNNLSYNNFSSSICSGDNRFCSWCGRITETCESGRTNSLSCNSINTVGHFCSEACFTAGRSAVFKQAKTCDWCRHIKNPISYVDFQDGESQLQFCSDKCLNQYKMNIFCHETQTHLMLHGLNTVSYHDTEKSNLITPELWFRNCQSPVGSSTESTFAADEHTTFDLSSHDKSKENEENEIEKSLESSRKTIKKRDSFCIQLCAKATNYNENRKNVGTGMNENDINEQNKKQSSVNEDKKFCHLLDNQNHCTLNCPQQSTVNCNNFAKNCSLINVINCDSHSHEHNNTLFKNNIYVKDIRVLQEEKKDTPTENIVCTPHLFVDTSASRTEHDATTSPKCLTNKFNRAKYKKQINHSSRTPPSLQSNQADSSGQHALSSSILPPVTVLVPYPIPVPIPIPIPVPIPTPILNKLVVGEQKIPTNTIDPEYKNQKCNESIENKCSMLQESHLCRNANIFVSDEPQHATSTKLCVSLTSSSINHENNDNVQPFKCSAKPPRKRKHLNENINYEHKEQQLKKRNKSIAT
ncbi:sine oculis-binding protein isoform X2 [Halictus rubicundus]